MARRLRNGPILLFAAVLAIGLLFGCASDTSDVDQRLTAVEKEIAEFATQVQQLQAAAQQMASEEQQLDDPSVRPTLIVKPSFFEFPSGRMSGVGNVWLYGSGLEPGQWFNITVHKDGEGGELPFLGGPDFLRQANDDGGFAVPLTRIDARPGRYAVLNDEIVQRGGVFVLKLWDGDTPTLLASTPWVVCGQARENPWCNATVDTAIVPEPVVEGPGTVWNISRVRIMDDWFQLRVGSDAKWGYEADARIDSREGDGWVMTIALGDTIAMERLENRGSTNHNFTIADLGIDIAMTPDQRIEPFKVKPEKVGEFVIDDSTDPGAHGKAKLIVTE